VRPKLNDQQCLIPTEQFVEITNMDLTQCYVLYTDGKLPIVRCPHHTFVDIADFRAKQYLPDYKPAKDLF
jgi:hypothetical protein